jgi:hypothetical protein
MKLVCFELTMPNNNSWNGKWSGEDRKYYVIERLVDDMAQELNAKEWYYDFGDGWMACITADIIDAKEAKKRKKISAGFCGYDWMVISIKHYGQIKKRD